MYSLTTVKLITVYSQNIRLLVYAALRLGDRIMHCKSDTECRKKFTFCVQLPWGL